ncbi:uncharacterized protein LOC143198319 [Rhynchophorus ferrugineus]|uniref:uncharacterized protein LOC143198319 n=1 Tax=Rhynchophorus ferrugineus TaxID=354439 RepID=UPI003FCEA6B0
MFINQGGPSYLTVISLSIVLTTSSPIRYINEVDTNILNNNDARIIPPGCCILPSCKPTGKCYQMLSCGHVCTAGYARGYFNTRASYKIREYYEKLKCRNDICKIERIYCRECLNPQSSISSTDIDCERCYYQK